LILKDSSAVSSKENKNISPDAVDQIIDYSCNDSILFSLSDEKMFLYGAGNLTAKGMNLKSAYVEISTGESYLFAETVKDSSSNIKPVIQMDKDIYTVKSIKYNFKSKRALIIDTKTEQEQGFHLHAERGKLQTNEELHICNGKFTTCDLEHPHFYIKLTKAKKIPDKHVISGPMYFVIADIPLYIIGLPFGLLPKQQKNSSGILMPEYGEDVTKGFYLRNGGYFWAINDKMNASLTGEVYSKGSWGLTLNSTFKQMYKYSGGLNLMYSKHRTGEKELPDAVSINTFWIRGTYTQDPKANPNSNFSVSLDLGSSQHTALNAKNIEENANSQTSSNISYMWAKPGSIFNFSTKLGYTQNVKTHMVNLNLPTFSLNVKKQFPFKNLGSGSSKWYQKIGYSINLNAKNSVNTTDSILFTEQTINNMQNGLQYSVPIGTSFNIIEFITVAPNINFTGRVYAEYLVQRNILEIKNNEVFESVTNDTINKINFPFNFNISFPFSTKLYGMFKFKKGKVEAIRHVMSPSISFNYNPDFSKNFWGFYDNLLLPDGEIKTYSHTGGFIYGTPPTGRSGAIGLSIGNNIEMKMRNKTDSVKESKKISILDNFNFSTAYNLAVEEFNLSPVRISGNTKLFGNFSARFEAVFDPYTVDEEGKSVNKFELSENKRIARFETARFSVSGTLKPGTDENSANNNASVNQTFYYYPYPEIPYTDMKIPWNLSLNYDFVLNKTSFDVASQSFVPTTTQTISLNGGLSLTENWKISANTRYDFSAQKFISANLSVYRDLHCWEMSFNVIPFGTWKSYTFRINIKSSVLKDLKYEKRKEVNRSSLYGNSGF
jgi:hypothetical protein